jgi:hypothetical protein
MSQITSTTIGVSYSDDGTRTVAASATRVTVPDDLFQRLLGQAKEACAPKPAPAPASASPATTTPSTPASTAASASPSAGTGSVGCGPHAPIGAAVRAHVSLDMRKSWLPTGHGSSSADATTSDSLMQQLRQWMSMLADSAREHGRGFQASAKHGHQQHRGSPPIGATIAQAATGGSTASPGSTAPTSAAPPAAAATPTLSVTNATTADAAVRILQQGTKAQVSFADANEFVRWTDTRSTDAPIEVGARLETGMRTIGSMLHQLGDYMLAGNVPTQAELDSVMTEGKAIFEEATRLRTGDQDLGEFSSASRDGVLQLGASAATTPASASPTDTSTGSATPPAGDPATTTEPAIAPAAPDASTADTATRARMPIADVTVTDTPPIEASTELQVAA